MPLLPVVPLVDGMVEAPVEVPAAAPLTPVAVVLEVPEVPDAPLVVSVVAGATGVAALGVVVMVDVELGDDVVSLEVVDCAWATFARATAAEAINSF
ncbi:hypothetical protein [Noviherbaspirillum galbum]|uniref:Uncharacterized protein n=1 Tax=Noviherbaspirillum galbum TaxID=2709383 RepID=A0A6B3SYS6_9BURK|nr:hypothetical protein [Noviherbaspirillum galbum]NEX63289.1 hypothetical protein [Noviherbaspirillum galbum]